MGLVGGGGGCRAEWLGSSGSGGTSSTSRGGGCGGCRAGVPWARWPRSSRGPPSRAPLAPTGRSAAEVCVCDGGASVCVRVVAESSAEVSATARPRGCPPDRQPVTTDCPRPMLGTARAARTAPYLAVHVVDLALVRDHNEGVVRVFGRVRVLLASKAEDAIHACRWMVGRVWWWCECVWSGGGGGGGAIGGAGRPLMPVRLISTASDADSQDPEWWLAHECK